MSKGFMNHLRYVMTVPIFIIEIRHGVLTNCCITNHAGMKVHVKTLNIYYIY